MLAEGTDAQEILSACQKAMQEVGKRFEEGVYFIPELVYGGEIVRKITELIKPKLAGSGLETEKMGKAVIGTVAGDIHDIGKNIVSFMLDINGFEVYDLGVDVPPEKFVEKIKEVNPEVVGLSGFLTAAFDSMKETVEAVKAAGYRDTVKIMIGGSTVTEEVKDYAGADVFGEDAVEAVNLAKRWVGVE